MGKQLFQDRAGKWRYRITGRNGEKMVTSQAYCSRGNAARGYNDLKKVIEAEDVIEP